MTNVTLCTSLAGGRLALHMTHCWDFFSSVKEKKSIFVLLIENFVNGELELWYLLQLFQIIYLDKLLNIKQPFFFFFLFAAQIPFKWKVLAFCYSPEASKSCRISVLENHLCVCCFAILPLSNCSQHNASGELSLSVSSHSVILLEKIVWETKACEVTKITGLNGSGIPGKKLWERANFLSD